jgi:hypothetical protein
LYGGNFSGAVNKKISYFLDFMRREIDDNAIINTVIVKSNLVPTQFT